MEIFLCGSTYDSIFREDLDSVVTVSDTEFILSADHTERLDSADLGLLDFEVSRENCSKPCKENFLAGCHIRGSTDNCKEFACTIIDLSYMEMI